MRILLVSHELSYTGAPRSLLIIAELLEKKGYIVDVYSLKEGPFEKEFIAKGIVVKYCVDKMSIKEIQKYDLVILNTIFCSYLVEKFQKYVRTLLYIREAKNIIDISEDCGIDLDCIRNAKEVICTSEYAKNYVEKICFLSKIYVLHNCIEDKYTFSLNTIKNKEINFMISGTYEKRKGHDLVIDAFLNLDEELKKITKLHIVGNTPEWSKEFWSELRNKYDNRIVEHGYIVDEEERLELYKEMQVFVIGSRDESCSLVALEGAMLGKALIMSNNVGASYLDNRKCCNIYETFNKEALIRKMSELTSRKKLLFDGLYFRNRFLKTSTKRIYEKELLKVIREEV